jgi:hypothetical protein
MSTGLRAVITVLVVAAVACGSSSPHGATDGGSTLEDADGDVTDAPPAASDGGEALDAVTGPYPSEDAPEYGPDGCLLTAIACTDDTMCCSGFCNQGECGSHAHPADVPGP